MEGILVEWEEAWAGVVIIMHAIAGNERI